MRWFLKGCRWLLFITQLFISLSSFIISLFLLYDLLDITYVSHPPPSGKYRYQRTDPFNRFYYVIYIDDQPSDDSFHFISPSILFQTILSISKYDILEVDERLLSHPSIPLPSYDPKCQLKIPPSLLSS